MANYRAKKPKSPKKELPPPKPPGRAKTTEDVLAKARARGKGKGKGKK